jgi:SAM-dependent methyltransferase
MGLFGKITRVIEIYRRLLERRIKDVFKSVIEKKAREHAVLFSNAPDYPSSAASVEQTLAITALGATETLSRLLEIAKVNYLNPTEYSQIQQRVSTSGVQDLEVSLRSQFDSNGSDKGSSHGYSNLYALILAPLMPSAKIRILEIGLGTNSTNVPSNMGREGVPGASLRAWASASEKIEVVGLDVDKKVLFQEPRISTYYVDQLNRESWLDLPQSVLENGFDLIIDDGLHAPLANLNTLLETSKMLRKGGVIVIEDVPQRALPIWTLVDYLLKKELKLEVIKFKRAFCVVLSKRD